MRLYNFNSPSEESHDFKRGMLSTNRKSSLYISCRGWPKYLHQGSGDSDEERGPGYYLLILDKILHKLMNTRWTNARNHPSVSVVVLCISEQHLNNENIIYKNLKTLFAYNRYADKVHSFPFSYRNHSYPSEEKKNQQNFA